MSLHLNAQSMRLLPAVPLLLFGLAASAMGEEWPSGFVVHSGTESSNGRYAILVPPQEPESNEDGDCYLADIQSHRVLGKLKAVDYFENQNHAGLSAIWNADRCVVTREAKAEAYDQELNQVYSALRFILPKTEFEKVKGAQVAWLKQRDAAPSIEEKNRRVLARIKTLKDLLW